MTTSEPTGNYPAGARPLRRRRDRRTVVALVSAVALVLIAGLGSLLYVGLHQSHPAKVAKLLAAPPSVSQAMTSIPSSTYAAVGAGTVAKPGLPAATGGKTLGHGRPDVLFIGAQFCPFCAAQRWALVAALSRFGTFGHFDLTRSAEYNVATFSFVRTTYTSRYVTFTPREVEDQNGRPLQHLDQEQRKQWATYLAPGTSGETFPFIDADGRYVITAASVDVNELLGKSAAQIAAAVRNPSTAISKTVLGAANQITAAICRVTGNQPSSVCTPQVQSLAGQFPTYHH